MKKLSEYFVGPKSAITEVVERIDRGAAQIALVVENEILIGTVTDGDIRRALLRGDTLESPVEKIMRREYRFLNVGATEEEALKMMRRETLHQIPVIDRQGKVVKLYLLEDLIRAKKHPNAVVIMAGGRGHRLGSLTQSCPKPMLRIAEKPILEIILQQCIDAGFHNFYLSVNYLKEQIKDYFQDGRSWGISIQYLEEKIPLGTAGCLSLLNQKFADPLLIMNGDLLTQLNHSQLLKFHSEQLAMATVCVREYITKIPYGVVNIDDLQVLAMDEKPVLMHHVNAGISLINPDLIALVPKNTFFDMPQLIQLAIQRGKKICAFPIHEYWLDIGHPETLERAQYEWQK